MSGLIDFHSHILPQVDDGSSSMEMTLSMLQKEIEQGVCDVVATPHFYAQYDSPERFLERREAAYRKIGSAEQELPITIHLGAEVAYFRGMSESEVLRKLCIGQSNYILVELPMSPWTDAVYEELAQIKSRQGLTPIVAHIDRYLTPFQTGRMLRRLEDLPVLIQANAEFFLERRTAKTAMKLLREGRIHLLGSDCHDLRDRAPKLGEAAAYMEAHGGKEMLRQICSRSREIL